MVSTQHSARRLVFRWRVFSNRRSHSTDLSVEVQPSQPRQRPLCFWSGALRSSFQSLPACSQPLPAFPCSQPYEVTPTLHPQSPSEIMSGSRDGPGVGAASSDL